MSGLYRDRKSQASAFAEAVGWLWRLPVTDTPSAKDVGIGAVADAERLDALVGTGELAAAIVFAPDAGPAAGPIPSRRRTEGVARFARGAALSGGFTVFEGGEPVVRTRRGAHAVRAGSLLAIGFDPVGNWGRLGLYWVLEAVRDVLLENLDRPLIQLPALGSIRFDDLPGTAQQQLNGEDKTDAKVLRRVERLIARYRKAEAKLSIAVVANALADEQLVPIQDVWPRSTAALAEGVAQGIFEPVLHGWIHYDAEASEGDVIEPREFARLGLDEARRRLDEALAWQRENLGTPKTFVAPAWGYSDGTREAARERGLPAWHRAAAEPLIVDGNPRETLIGAGGEGGVHRLDYGALARLAGVGVPPTPVLHGGLLDDRLSTRVLRDAPGYARLLLRRDAERLPFVKGVRWVGAGELVDRLASHGQVEYREGQVILPEGGEAVVVDRSGATTVRG